MSLCSFEPADPPTSRLDRVAARKRIGLLAICGALTAVVGCLILIAAWSMEMLTAARAYTQGEALWSKGQKDAVLHLDRYTRSRSEADYELFRESISVPLACRTFRNQMDLAQYDVETVRTALHQIGIHEDDHRRTIWFYRYLAWEPHIKKAVSLWKEAERGVEALERTGGVFHGFVIAGAVDQALSNRTLAEIHRINDVLTPTEQRFSQALAAGGRWLHTFLMTVLSAVGFTLVVAATWGYAVLFNRLANSEHKYRHLIDTASEAILIADARTGKIMDANRKAIEMLGQMGPATAQSALSLLNLDAQVKENVRLSESTSTVAKREARVHSASGAEVDVEFSGSMVTIHGRNVVALIVRDITEQNRAAALIRESEQRYRHLSEELRLARDQALDASRAKSQFLANMSHEIRTPMNGVIGMLSLGLERCSDEVQRDHLECAQAAARALLAVINDILDLARIEVRKVTIEAVDFDLCATCEQVTKLFETAVREKGIQVALSFGTDGPIWVRGDAVRIRQILLNLVGNAVKFTSGGVIAVRVRQRDTGVRFEVEDSGIGIAPDKLEIIFEPFTQADESHARQFGGTGLGLTITRGLVELMQGRISARSELGHGACFTVDLPLPQCLPAAPFATASNTSQDVVRNLPRLKVLVAEDNSINQKVIRALLDRYDWAVTLASNGREAYEQVRVQSFDLILMDVQMPAMDGIEATRLIRQHEESAGDGSRLPILALTAHASRDQHDQCLACGMDGVVTKPVEPSVLLEAIVSVMERVASGPMSRAAAATSGRATEFG